MYDCGNDLGSVYKEKSRERRVILPLHNTGVILHTSTPVTYMDYSCKYSTLVQYYVACSTHVYYY